MIQSLRLVVGCVALFGVLLLGAESARAEGQPNWLSEVVKKARSEYRLESRQHSHIRAAILSAKEGKELAASPKLDQAITAGLQAAAQRQKEMDANPKLATASPAVQASWTIFETAGVPVPMPEQ